MDNYLHGFEIGNQIAKLPEKKTEEMTDRIVNDIRNRKHNQATATLIWRGIAAMLRKSGKTTDGNQAQRFIVNDQCTKCGICTKVCPEKNNMVTDKVLFFDRCEGCEACLHLCPHNVTHIRREKSNKRWRNPDVSLREIMEANSRI